MSTTVSGACEECGFDDEVLLPEDAPEVLRGFARRYRAPLSRFLPGEDGDDVVRQRPGPDVWSALEYAGHVRDVLGFWSWAIHQTMKEEPFELPLVDPDEVAADRGYADLEPAAVADELAANAERMAVEVEAVPTKGWARTAGRPDGDVTALWMLRHAVHEGNHHLLDIGRVLRTVREKRA